MTKLPLGIKNPIPNKTSFENNFIDKDNTCIHRSPNFKNQISKTRIFKWSGSGWVTERLANPSCFCACALR